MDFYAGPEGESILKNKRNRTIAWIFFILFISIICLGGAVVYIDYKIKIPADQSGPQKIVVIKKGDGAKEIAKELEKEGIIENNFYFLTYVFFKRAYPYLQAGSYNLSSRINIPEIVDILTKGNVIPTERQITIPEGWNNKQIDDYLFNRRVIKDKKDFINNAVKTSEFFNYDFLADFKKGESLEGFLFPDTYQVFKDADSKEIIRKMLDNFGKKLSPELRGEIKEQGKTIPDIIKMASIVELEVPGKEDREIVAGILWKRLENNIPLQADITVRYATGNFNRPLTKDDLFYNSPYNTRIKKGLTPTPICNPGIEAITAVIYPRETEYWYYLSAPDGKTIYSKTYTEHLEAKRKYLE